jgi:hypothetical protein
MNLSNKLEIWVSQRVSLKAPWGGPVNLDAFNTVPVVNSIGSPTYAPNFSADGHLLFFSSPRPGGLGGAGLYVSRRTNKHEDFGWQTPVNLGLVINSPQDDEASTYFEDEETGIIVLYFASTRPGGPVGPGSEHIYVSTLGDDGSFGPAVLVPELSSPYNSTLDPWSSRVNFGPTVNYPGYVTGAPALSWDGTTLYCYSTRPGGFGARDLYVTTRRKLRRHE